MRCAIGYHLYKLRGKKKHPWRSVAVSKVVGWKPACLLGLTLLHGCFSRFLSCAGGTISRGACVWVPAWRDGVSESGNIGQGQKALESAIAFLLATGVIECCLHPTLGSSKYFLIFLSVKFFGNLCGNLNAMLFLVDIKYHFTCGD